MNDFIDNHIAGTLRAATASPAVRAALDGALADIKRAASAAPAAPAATSAPASSTASAAQSARAAARRRAAPRRPLAWGRVAAAVAVASLGVGGTAFAADALGLLSFQQTDTYQATLAVGAEERAAGPVEDFRLAFTELPVGAEEIDRNDHLAKYQWNKGADSFSAALFYLDSNEPMPVSFTTGGRAVTIAGHEGVIFEKPDAVQNTTVFDMYLVFPEMQRVAWLWTDSLTPDELSALAAAIELEPNGKTVVPGTPQGEGCEGDYLATWSDEVVSHRQQAESLLDEGAGEAVKTTASAEEMGNLHTVGDSFPVNCSARQTAGDLKDAGDILSAQMSAVEVRDDLSSLDAARVPETWNALVGGDGSLGTVELRYGAFGNGRDTLDEVVRREHVPVKLVEATVAYTNDGDEPLDDVLVVGTLLRATENAGQWTVFNRCDAVAGAEDVWCDVEGVTDGDPRYWLIDEAHRGEKNHLAHLEPGETATVRYAWLVPADELDKLLLNLSGGGAWYSFEKDDLARGFVDIRQDASA